MLVDVPGDDLYGGTLRGKDDGNKPQEGARARGGWGLVRREEAFATQERGATCFVRVLS